MVRESREAPSELHCAENRTMQDMTDNPRAFYEYLIQNKINENYQIIWMVSDKKKCKKLKCKNVKFVTAENKYGWSSPLSYYYGAVAGFFSIQTIQLT